jgi:Bacterial regulatory helix-turn-helix protein, lysR family
MFELSQLRCFVAAAEELHFGRAAERLHMTQPPLSRQVQILERILGVQLLARTSRIVRLRPAVPSCRRRDASCSSPTVRRCRRVGRLPATRDR